MCVGLIHGYSDIIIVIIFFNVEFFLMIVIALQFTIPTVVIIHI